MTQCAECGFEKADCETTSEIYESEFFSDRVECVVVISSPKPRTLCLQCRRDIALRYAVEFAARRVRPA